MDGLVEALERLDRAVARLERALAAGEVPRTVESRAWKGDIAARLDGALDTIARVLGGEA